MPDRATLLPPNATQLERSLEQATARLADVTTPIVDLWDPQACPAALLPWLAWALSVDRWDSAWSEAAKRAAIAGSIELHRHKGTRLSVETVLASFDQLLELVEWWQAPGEAPHTFDVILPLDGAGGTRSTAAFAEAIIREVARVKPARSHMRMVQALETAGQIGVIAAARFTEFRRDDAVAAADTSLPWATFLQDENGEPLEASAGGYLEDIA